MRGFLDRAQNVRVLFSITGETRVLGYLVGVGMICNTYRINSPSRTTFMRIVATISLGWSAWALFSASCKRVSKCTM